MRNLILLIIADMRKKVWMAAALLLAVAMKSLACTNLIVGKAASTDGSVLVTYSAASNGMFGHLCHYLAGRIIAQVTEQYVHSRRIRNRISRRQYKVSPTILLE